MCSAWERSVHVTIRNIFMGEWIVCWGWERVFKFSALNNFGRMGFFRV